jgi:hypothetical protein
VYFLARGAVKLRRFSACGSLVSRRRPEEAGVETVNFPQLFLGVGVLKGLLEDEVKALSQNPITDRVGGRGIGGFEGGGRMACDLNAISGLGDASDDDGNDACDTGLNRSSLHLTKTTPVWRRGLLTSVADRLTSATPSRLLGFRRRPSVVAPCAILREALSAS